MNTTKQMGIWMDHSSAFLMELSKGEIVEHVILSQFTKQDKDRLHQEEKTLHHKEQLEQAIYYKKIGEVILGFNEVLLFGPSEAKNELVNLLKADYLFRTIKIEVKSADKMTDVEMHSFVKEYFK